MQHDGKVFIVYSCNGSWTKDYRLAYLMLDVGDNPMDPTNWKKSPNAVFYRCDDTVDEDGVNGLLFYEVAGWYRRLDRLSREES